MTLIELLVVMVILTTLVAAAMPILAPAGDERVLREASRGVNTFISGAQARAIASGRPFGVALKKLAQDTGALADASVCLEMFYVEEPAPYSGFDEAARVRLALDIAPGGAWIAGEPYQVRIQFVRLDSAATAGMPSGVTNDLVPPAFFGPGDSIFIDGAEFVFTDTSDIGVDRNSNGKTDPDELLYLDTSGTPDGTLVARGPANIRSLFDFVYDNSGARVTSAGAPLTAPYWTEPLRYELHRRPQPTSNEPFQLPTGAAIDLRASGATISIIGDDDDSTRTEGEFSRPDDDVSDPSKVDNPIQNATPVFIMFSPEGNVDRVIYDPSYNDFDPTTADVSTPLVTAPISSSIHLLVGLRDNIPAPWVADYSDTSVFVTDADRKREKAKVNWLNLESRWVVIGAQTGSVNTVKNSFVDPTDFYAPQVPTTYSPLAQRAAQINASRALARESAREGGR